MRVRFEGRSYVCEQELAGENMSPEVQFLTDKPSLRKAIQEATHPESRAKRVRILTLTIGAFEFSDGRSLEGQLQRLLAKDTQLVMIVGQDPRSISSDMKDVLRDLENRGAKLYHRDSMHAKMVLAQGSNWHSYYLGSANFTRNGMYGFDELGVKGAGTDPTAFAELSDYFTRKVGESATVPLVPLL